MLYKALEQQLKYFSQNVSKIQELTTDNDLIQFSKKLNK